MSSFNPDPYHQTFIPLAELEPLRKRLGDLPSEQLDLIIDSLKTSYQLAIKDGADGDSHNVDTRRAHRRAVRLVELLMQLAA